MSRTAKFLLYALLASVLVHFLLLYLLPKFDWPDFAGGEITAEIVPIKSTASNFKPIAPPKPKAQAEKPAEKAGAAPVKKAESALPASSAAAAQVSAPVALAASEVVAEKPKVEKKAKAAGDEVPKRATLVFDVYKGTLRVGRALQEWEIRDDGHYSISNSIEATGLFSLFYSKKMLQSSVGTITENGLRPDLYTIVRGDEKNRQSSRFDWEKMTVSLESDSGKREVKLDPSTQDQLSFIYQFAYSKPVSGVFHFMGTDGRKVDSYDYAILGEEELDIDGKKTRTLHLKKLHSSEGTDLWLAIDHYYWPAKIRMTDKNGDSLEQVIREIK